VFDNVTWEAFGWVSLYVFIGLALRTFGPYFVAAFELIKETNVWQLPKFEPKYVLSPAATLGILIVSILTVQDALYNLTLMHPAALIASIYAGQDVVRQFIKVFYK